MDKLIIDIEKLKKQNWSEKEINNVTRVTDFMQHLMNNHDFQYVRKTFNNNKYKQHNRGIPDGMENLITYVEKFSKQFPEYTYDVKHIHADGDHVIFHSHATVRKKHRGNDKKGLNIIDIWTLQDGDIVEHWDSLQPLDTFMRLYTLIVGGSIKNTNGVF